MITLHSLVDCYKGFEETYHLIYLDLVVALLFGTYHIMIMTTMVNGGLAPGGAWNSLRNDRGLAV
jgi:hypothetical protein